MFHLKQEIFVLKFSGTYEIGQICALLINQRFKKTLQSKSCKITSIFMDNLRFAF